MKMISATEIPMKMKVGMKLVQMLGALGANVADKAFILQQLEQVVVVVFESEAAGVEAELWLGLAGFGFWFEHLAGDGAGDFRGTDFQVIEVRVADGLLVLALAPSWTLMAALGFFAGSALLDQIDQIAEAQFRLGIWFISSSERS